MNHWTKLDTPVCVGACYKNGMSWYQVLRENVDGTLWLLRSDGWMLTAHGAALYETRRGLELLWDYSTDGHFTETGFVPSERRNA